METAKTNTKARAAWAALYQKETRIARGAVLLNDPDCAEHASMRALYALQRAGGVAVGFSEFQRMTASVRHEPA